MLFCTQPRTLLKQQSTTKLSIKYAFVKMKFDAKNAKQGTMLNMDICQGG